MYVSPNNDTSSIYIYSSYSNIEFDNHKYIVFVCIVHIGMLMFPTV